MVVGQAAVGDRLDAVAAPAPLADEETGTLMVSWLRVDNRSEVIGALDLDAALATEMSDEQLVLAGYRQWGTDVAGHLEGEFAFAIVEPERRRVYLARDRIGTRPLFVVITPDVCAFGTTLAFFRSLRGVDDEPDPVWMASYIVGLPHPDPASACTALKGANRVEGGSWLLVTPDVEKSGTFGELIDDAPWVDHRDPVWLGQYREALERAVADRVMTEAPLGIENSAGLDSSSVIALAALVRPEARRTTHTFGYAVERNAADWALLTPRMWWIGGNHLWTHWYGVDADESQRRSRHSVAVLGHPPTHGNVTGQWEIFEAAQRFGVRVLLSGHGGDECVTSYGDQVVTEAVARRAWGVLSRDLPGRRTLRPLRSFARYLRGSPRNPGTSWASDLAYPEFVPEVARSVTERHRSVKAFAPSRSPTVNGHALAWLTSAYRYPRLEQGAALAASFGLEYRWPLFDRRLVQQYLSTPAVWKLGDGQFRYLHRCAVSELLPDEILGGNTKGMGEMAPPPPRTAAVRTPERIGGLDPRVSALFQGGLRFETGQQPYSVRVDALSQWLVDR